MKTYFLTIISLVFVVSGCSKSVEKDVVGKWSYEMKMPMDDKDATGEMLIKCVSEFFPTKSVNHDCEMNIAMTMKEGGAKLEMGGSIQATGEWSTADKNLYDKTIDTKFELKKFTANGEAVTDEGAKADVKKTFENAFVKGQTTTYITTSLDGKKWIFEQEIDKKKVSISASKQ
jgi:hypothetical protein